jgi:hypothetical protein
MSMYCRLVVVMNPQSARACPELRAKARFVLPERWETGVVGGREDEGLLGKDGEDGGVRGGDGVEQVDGGVADGIVAVNVEELTGGAVEAVEGHVVGIDGATTRT